MVCIGAGSQLTAAALRAVSFRQMRQALIAGFWFLATNYYPHRSVRSPGNAIRRMIGAGGRAADAVRAGDPFSEPASPPRRCYTVRHGGHAAVSACWSWCRVPHRRVCYWLRCGGGNAPTDTPTAAAPAIVQTPIARVASAVAPALETPVARAQTSVADIPTKVASIVGTPGGQISGVVGTVEARSPGVLPRQGACPADHPLKGRIENFRSIYHLPGSADYDQVKPEICFATEADAQAVGFHPPSQ